MDGKYSISVTPEDVLVFSYVGMTSQTIKVGTQNVINVTLKEDSQVLAETVVIGYGSAKKRDLTGSITNIKGEELANKPAMNPLSSLQGKVAGVQIVNSGRAGSDPEIRIRGTNSINGYKPLYIVDGLFNDNINFLNPEDIESMEILKDPSSLAIFGVRGANGVIIITTKKAKEGQTLVNINTSFGFKKVVDKVKLVNGSQFKELYNEQLANQKDDPFDYTGWDANTDWQDEIFQTAFITNNNISITGASPKHSFYLGVGYSYEQGNIEHEKFSSVLQLELLQVLLGGNASLLQVACLGLAQLVLLDVAKAELDGGVAVGLNGLLLSHDAGACFHNGNRDDLAALIEDLGHAHFFADDCFFHG